MSLQCHLESLAPELLLQILKYLPDLESLDSLLQASPASSRLFNLCAAEVFETVLSSGWTDKYTCALIRIVALIRSNALPPEAHSFLTLQNLITHETTALRYVPSIWQLPATKLPPQSSPCVLRGLVATSSKIGQLSFGCLEYYLQRFKALRPSHPAQKDFLYCSTTVGSGNDEIFLPAWKLRPKESPFPIRDIGPPSWAEIQRAQRAFWQIELVQNLRTAVNNSSIIWEDQQIRRLNKIELQNFYKTEALDQSRPIKWGEYQKLELELIRSMIQYIQEHKGMIDQVAYQILRKRWSPLPDLTRNSKEFVGNRDRTMTWSIYQESSGSPWIHLLNGCSTPLQHVSFEPYRRLGFAIWDTERMAGYGLSGLERTFANLNPLYFMAWRSILSVDEVAELDKENEKRDLGDFVLQ